MAKSVQLLAEKQTEKVNGALIVCHQSAVPAKEAQKIAQPLIDKFVTGALVKASTNMKMPHHGQISVMFSRFVALAYARYPGPWLIIDSPSDANVENWAKAAIDKHNLHGGKVVGTARKDGKTLLTYGPLTIHLSSKSMRMLHFSTNESWRSRGRYLLMNAGLQTVDPEEWVFREIEASESQSPSTKQPEQIKEDAASMHTREEVEEKQWDPNDEREGLMNLIQKATGKRPHHFTGLDKLREMVQQLEQPTSE